MSYEFQELVDGVYERFGAPATLTDRHERLLAYSIQPADRTDPTRRQSLLDRRRDESTRYVNDFAHRVDAAARMPAVPHLGLLERLVIPLRVRATTTGYLYAIDPSRRIGDDVLEQLGPSLDAVARQIEFEHAAQVNARMAVHALVSPDEDERATAVDFFHERGLDEPATAWRVAVLAPEEVPAGPQVVVPRIFGARSFWTELNGRYVCLVAEDAARAHAARERLVGPESDTDGYAIGIGPSFGRLDQAYQSYRAASRALQLAQSGMIGSRCARWDDMGPWRALLSMDRAAVEASIDPRVARLIEDSDESLLRVLRSYLEREKDSDELAAEYYVHRTTLYARFRRLQERYGLSWDDADDRLAAVIGLRIALLNRES